MEILDGPRAEKRIRSLLGDARWVRIAVAYWGGDAIGRLGLGKLKTDDVHIVCDLRSGGCDPAIITQLQDLFGRKRVLTNDRLHAKLWLTDQGAVIGSSNASTNGFGKVGQQASGLIEVNVFTTDASARAELLRMFEEEISPSSSTPLKNDFDVGQEGFDTRRRARPVRPAPSLLDALVAEPSDFDDRDVFVWSYPEEDFSKAERDEVDADAKELNIPDLSGWFLRRKDADTLRPGAIVIEFDCAKGRQAKFDDAYQVLLKGEPNASGFIKVLCRPVQRIFGLKLGDMSVWEKAATRAAASVKSGDWSGEIAVFGRQFL